MDAATLPATHGTKSPTVCNEFERRWAVTIRLKSFCFSEGQHCSVSSFHCSACVVWRPLCSSNASTRPEWQSEDGLRVFLDFSGHVRFPLACLALMRELQMKAHILQQNSYVVLGSRKDGNFSLSSPEDLMGQRLQRHRLWSSTLVTMTFRLVQPTSFLFRLHIRLRVGQFGECNAPWDTNISDKEPNRRRET